MAFIHLTKEKKYYKGKKVMPILIMIDICVQRVVINVKTCPFTYIQVLTIGNLLTRYAFLFWWPCCVLCRVAIAGARNVTPYT